jgi:hypothetical protein
VSLQHRLKQLERKAGINEPIRHAPPLFNPSEKEIEQARRMYPGAILFIIDIGPPPKEACGIAE